MRGTLLRRWSAPAAALLAAAVGVPAHARHVVRDERFDWQLIRTPHFDIQFYGDEVLPRAREVGAWLEQAFARHAASLGATVRRRTPVFLYRSHNDFEQTNLYPVVPEHVGAFADASRDRIVLPLYPSEKYMQTVLEHELVHIYQFASLYPYRVPSYLLLVSWLHPQWFIEGMADHLSLRRDSDVEMRLRDSALDGTLRPLRELRGFNHLNPHEVRAAYEEGAAFFEYLDRISGGGAAKRILRIFSLCIPWSIDTLFLMATGAEFKRTERHFIEDTVARARAASAGRSDPGALALSDDRGHYRVYNVSPRWSPDGRRIVFLTDRRETYGIHVMNADGSGRRALLRGKLNSVVEFVRSGHAAVDWSRDGSRLCFCGEWVNQDYLYVLDLDRGRALERYSLPFDEIATPAFSPDGRRIALSGVTAGVSDICTYDLETGEVRRLTSDRYHDEAPSWSPDGTRIVYTSERGGQTDLYLLEVATGTSERLTDSLALDRYSDWSPDGSRIAFGSDVGGISNIWVMDVASRRAQRLTDVIGGAFGPSWSPDGSAIAFGYYRHGSTNIYVMRPGPGEFTAALPEERERASELEGFRTGSIEVASEPFRDSFGVDLFVPLGIMNPIKAGDLRGEHVLTGDVTVYTTEFGNTVSGQLMWEDLSGRADLGIGAFFQAEQLESSEDNVYGLRAGATYPFDQYRKAELAALAYRRDRTGTGTASSELFVGLSLVLSHDNRIGRGLDYTGGTRYEAGATVYDEALGSERSYLGYRADHTRYVALSRDQVLALRLSADVSKGPEPAEFDLSAVVRGVEPNRYEESNRFGASLEYRFPLARDLNWHVAGSYLLLKDLRAYLYADYGFVTPEGLDRPFDDPSGDEWHRSVGAGLRFDLYILQKIPFRMRAEAQQVDGRWRGALWLDLEFDF